MMRAISRDVIEHSPQTRVISAAAASVVPSECSACQCAGRPARTASRHEVATEVGGALAPKLVDELLLTRTAPLRTNLLESGRPRTVSASNLCIFVIIFILPSSGDVRAEIAEKPAPGPPLALTSFRIPLNNVKLICIITRKSWVWTILTPF